MDCVIPSYNIRTFSQALICLSKIGKDVYVEFDTVEGLTLRTLNDAKSAFSKFQFKPHFFRQNRPQSQSQEPYQCRIPCKPLQAVMKPRKGVTALRIRNEHDTEHLYLSFEFRLESRLQIVHRVAVADADGVTAVCSKEDASMIVTYPQFLWKMLVPLQNTREIALIINEFNLSCSTFHHGHHHPENSVLQTATAKVLNTETSIGIDELEEFKFQNDRDINDDHQEMPHNINQEVTIVIPVKETKAILQFCSSADDDLRTTLLFHWGGKPMIIETQTAQFHAEIILATLDHKLLRDPTTR